MVTNRSRALPSRLLFQSVNSDKSSVLCSVFKFQIFLDSSAAEHPAVNRRVVGSNPTRGFFCLRGQAVKTSPFHGGNTSSILVGVTTIWCGSQVVRPRSATPLSAGSNPARTFQDLKKRGPFFLL